VYEALSYREHLTLGVALRKTCKDLEGIEIDEVKKLGAVGFHAPLIFFRRPGGAYMVL
jgi:hypothetical protein